MISRSRHILLLVFLLLAGARPVWATHNRAGEITFSQLGKNSFQITLVTYTDSRSSNADRQQVELLYGDNTKETVERQLPVTNLGNNIQRNVYVAKHTYPGPGRYIIRFLDPNRIEGIKNIDNSVSVSFYVESELIIDPVQGYNQSPVLLQPPIDNACLNRLFTHNPNAYDADGDSLVFSLIPPKRDVDRDVPGYRSPNAWGNFTLDRFTGQLRWDVPKESGIFNIAILIEEYRNGKRIGYITRDMQIMVSPNCNGSPPVVAALKDTCVEAGANITLTYQVEATDVDKDELELTGSGGPFLQKTQPARLNPNPAYGTAKVTATFTWEIGCQHIRKEPYRVVFKAQETKSPIPQSDLKHVDIRVVGPAPLNLKAQAFGNGVQLAWEKPVCANAVGYRIYRRADSSNWKHDYCETGVPAYTGFQLINTVTNPNQLSYYDLDNGEGLAPGVQYCYVVTALYLNDGNFEFAEGYASNEQCARLRKDVPVLTHVSVIKTDALDGRMFVAWSKADSLDTVANPGPYQYKVYRSPGFAGSNFTLLRTYTSPTFAGLRDTSLLDSGLNTVEAPYSYKIEFYYTQGGAFKLVGKTITASSVFLKIRRAHEKLELSWQHVVPWRNTAYVVFKLNPLSGIFNPVDTVNVRNYTDTGLVNGAQHCYYVQSIGSFFTKGFPDPIYNNSQQVCSSACDTIVPCAPTLQAEAQCDNFGSLLNWLIDDSCNRDVNRYKVYFSPGNLDTFTLVDSVMGHDNMRYIDRRPSLVTSLAGCYRVTAIDTFDNESAPSMEICVENCPVYELPNAFTPNGDRFNDRFEPMRGFRFVESIDLHIFNRWGQEVFHTKNKDINWDGKDQLLHNDLPDGVYYYICTVNEIYREGIRTREVRGSLMLLR